MLLDVEQPNPHKQKALNYFLLVGFAYCDQPSEPKTRSSKASSGSQFQLRFMYHIESRARWKLLNDKTPIANNNYLTLIGNLPVANVKYPIAYISTTRID